MKSIKLQDHKYAQCKVQVEKIDGLFRIVLISYSTPVICAIEQPDILEFHLYCSGTYSPTTRKHIGYFLREYFPDLNYYDMKAIAGQDEYKLGCLPDSKKKVLQEVVK